MMEVQGVVLECGILVFGLLRNLLCDVCVNCGVGVFEAVCGKCLCFFQFLKAHNSEIS